MQDEFNTDVLDEAFPLNYEILGNEGQSDGTEIGVRGYGQSDGIEIAPELTDEIVGAAQAAVLKTITKARDSRRPAPPLRAVSLDEPEDEGCLSPMDYSMEEICIGAEDAFPITSNLLQQYGAGGESRIVRVDTEESYKQFRTDGSPEMAALQRQVAEVEQRLVAHMADPGAHHGPAPAIRGDIAELRHMGAEVAAIEEQKRIPLRMPKHFNGLVDAWREGDFAVASIVIPGSDGDPRIVTAMEPVEKGMLEAAKAATESGAPAAIIVGYIGEIGETLAAANAIKDLASAAPSILKRPEARGQEPFMVRLAPKTSPALFALAALSRMCAAGDAKACDEWTRLSAASPPVVKQAMAEILAVMKQPRAEAGASVSLGGILESARSYWDKALAYLGLQPKAPALDLPPAIRAALPPSSRAAA